VIIVLMNTCAYGRSSLPGRCAVPRRDRCFRTWTSNGGGGVRVFQAYTIPTLDELRALDRAG